MNDKARKIYCKHIKRKRKKSKLGDVYVPVKKKRKNAHGLATS